MRITEDKVRELAKLARLQFEGEELTKMQADLENILVMCEKLNGVDTEGKEPLISDFFRVPKVIDGNE